MDQVRREVEIDAPIADVWALITEPAHIRVWYAFDGAEVDLRAGGVIEHRWNEHGRYLGVIDVLDPPHRFGYRYANTPDHPPAIGMSTHVLFELVSLAPDRTLLRVTEKGIASLALSDEERTAYVEATTSGWEGGLAALLAHAAVICLDTPPDTP